MSSLEKNRNKMKLLIKHPEVRPYRRPLFSAFADLYDVKFMLNKKPQNFEFDYCVIGTNKFRSMWLDYNAVKRFFSELFGEYDVLMTTNPLASATIIAICIAKLRSKRVLLWDESWLEFDLDIRGRLKEGLNKFVYGLSNAVLATSVKSYAKYMKMSNGDNKKIYQTTQCVLDLSKHACSLQHKKITNKGNALKLLYFGRLVDVKGLKYLILAIDKLNKDDVDVELSIVGDGPERERCIQLSKSLCLTNCHFYPSIVDNDFSAKAKLYAAHDILVLPSINIKGLYESWGLVVNEALSMSKPVLVTDMVGCSEDLVENGKNGFVVSSSSADAIVEGIKQFVLSDVSLENFGARSRQIFEIKNDYSKMITIFNKALGNIQMKS